MGTDIRLHIEIQVNSRWYHYNHPSIERNYTLFEKMAGVRGNEEEAIVCPRGLPLDMTFMTRYDYEHRKADSYSMSYLGSDELIILYDWMADQYPDSVWPFHDTFGFLFGNGYDWFAKYRSTDNGAYPEELEDFRFIFWFD